MQTHFTIIPRGTKDERLSKEARRGGQRVKDRHQLAGIKKKIEHRGLCPLVDGKKEQRNEKKKEKKKKRRYSGDKDRSLTPHCFPFPFYWVTWRDPRSNFPPSSPFVKG